MNFLTPGLIPDASHLDQIQNFFDQSPFLSYIKDNQGKYLHANQSELNMVGLQHENDIIGLTDFDLSFSNEQARMLRTTDSKVIKQHSSFSVIENADTSSGETIQVISYKSPFRMISNKVVGIFGV